jgi:hypothetical protein
MLKAGVLYYTLFLMLISVIIISLVMMRYSLHQQAFTNKTKLDELDLNLKSAFLVYKHDPGIFSVSDSLDIDLYKDSLAMVRLTREDWGIFDIVTASAGWKNLSLSRSGLFGEVIDSKDPALYVADHGITVSLSGNSIIRGNSFVPGGVFRTASVEGQPFRNKTTSEGEVHRSESDIPEPDSKLDSTLAVTYNGDVIGINLSEIDRKNSLSIENPFRNPSVVYYSHVDAILSGLSFRGRIMIYAAGTVFIDRTTSLEDVIIVARRIIIDEGFTGSFQGFAIDSIAIGDNVSMNYPGVLAIAPAADGDATSSDAQITIGRNTIIKGCILLKGQKEKCRLVIPESTSLTGQVYCSGTVQMEGKVYGSIFCDGFSFRRENSTYINHLLNSDIDIERLPDGFAGFAVGNEKSLRTVIKWLD